MKAIVIEEPGGPEVLKIKNIPRPSSRPGWVLINVMAFGLNRSEMYTRQGHSPNVRFPRVLGIECVGVVVEASGGQFQKGQKVAAIMGGMGRDFDGGYAEYTCVPERCIYPLETDLDWAVLGAIPEMFQTAWGALHPALEVQPGQTLLIRGGTSSVGMCATQLAKRFGLTVIATTRNQTKIETLKNNGVDHVVIDKGVIVDSVRKLFPDGVDRVLELVGTVTLLDSLQCTAPGGIVCMAGILGNEWVIKEFEPFTMIPINVKLTIGGGTPDLGVVELQKYINDVASGQAKIKIDRIFQFHQIVEAHQYMEENRASGKLVVLVD
jgi:NADPH:quinone reductase-like Zn-dependent oxidoreductase